MSVRLTQTTPWKVSAGALPYGEFKSPRTINEQAVQPANAGGRPATDSTIKETQVAVIINVARKRAGDMPPRHVFCTAAGSIHTKSAACEIARTLSVVYPSDRFEITVSAEATYSEYLDWETHDGTL